LHIFQQPQRFDGAHFVYLQVTNFLLDLIDPWLEEANLHRREFGARRKHFGGAMLCALMQGEHFAGALDHPGRKAGKARDLDSITAVGFAGLDFAKEDNAVARFFDGDAEIANAVE
jgi:hypothetical protein